jgi:hypothetical protein
MNTNNGMCECGCGRKAPIAPKTVRKRGYVKGEPTRFLRGHSHRKPPHEALRTQDGYVKVFAPEHPSAQASGYILEHIIIAERALGKPLPKGAQVHHVNGIKDDNRPQNLVICQDASYHQLLHRRAKALEECGHAGWLKCKVCGEYDDPSALYVSPTVTSQCWHRECFRVWRRELRRQQRADG